MFALKSEKDNQAHNIISSMRTKTNAKGPFHTLLLLGPGLIVGVEFFFAKLAQHVSLCWK